jgi:protein Xni
VASKVLLVDAFNLIRRIFEAMSRSDTDLAGNVAEDVATDIKSIVQSCKQSMERAIRHHKPSHVCVVFDSHDTTWRNLLYTGYKAGRKPTPPALLDNIKRFELAFTELGVKSLTVKGYEADDVIATFASGVVNKSKDAHVVILSTDKGFLPFLSPQLSVVNHFDGQVATANWVFDKYQVSFYQLIDYWALAGDASNSIKGVPKIGKKTAAALLKDHGNLATILGVDDASGSVLRVQENIDLAKMSQLLVSLKTDMILGANLKDFRIV